MRARLSGGRESVEGGKSVAGGKSVKSGMSGRSKELAQPSGTAQATAFHRRLTDTGEIEGAKRLTDRPGDLSAILNSNSSFYFNVRCRPPHRPTPSSTCTTTCRTPPARRE